VSKEGWTVEPDDTADQEPTPRPWTDQKRETFWQDLDEIAEEINRFWPKGVSAEDAINDVRREL
jgi:hypothetical protein